MTSEFDKYHAVYFSLIDYLFSTQVRTWDTWLAEQTNESVNADGTMTKCCRNERCVRQYAPHVAGITQYVTNTHPACKRNEIISFIYTPYFLKFKTSSCVDM